MSTILRLSESGRAVRVWAQGHGEPVLLLHGVGLCAEVWAPQMRALSDTHQLIAVDLPGHGQSDPLPTESLLVDFVDWCHDLIDSLALGPVNLTGHSMGSLIALGTAATAPQSVRRLALLNAVHRRRPDVRAQVLSRAVAIAENTADVATPLERWFPEQQFAHWRVMVGAWLNNVEREAYATTYRAFALGDDTYADSISTLDMPLLAMTGELDPNSTPAMSTALAAHHPNARVELIAGARHMMPLTHADAANTALSSWLNTATNS